MAAVMDGLGALSQDLSMKPWAYNNQSLRMPSEIIPERPPGRGNQRLTFYHLDIYLIARNTCASHGSRFPELLFIYLSLLSGGRHAALKPAKKIKAQKWNQLCDYDSPSHRSLWVGRAITWAGFASRC